MRRRTFPPDLQKSELPYRANLVLSIRPHAPPPPFGNQYLRDHESQRKPADRQTILELTQSDLCLQYPPAETPPVGLGDPIERSLRIIDEIECRDGRGSQVVRCHFPGEDDDRVFVAKIYDPLYYSFSKDSGVPEDVTWEAEHDYSCEASAYEEMARLEIDGLYAPKYHGSWTFDMPFRESGKLRPVRMILMEWIECVTMQSLISTNRVASISPKQRLDILARAMEIDSKLQFHGILHRDFAPRNIILVGSNIETHMPKVYMIDFNISAVFSQPHCRYKHYGLPRPISPRYLYWDESTAELCQWLPEPYRSRDAIFRGWLITQWPELGEFGGPSESMKYCSDFDEPVEFVSERQDVNHSTGETMRRLNPVAVN